ncbi:MAG: hypothetical protein NZ889_01045 [Candidatus Pacearchaeota archaeon]|nr:hypothetical protein [Candidatus Pacearchaeota archaeon]
MEKKGVAPVVATVLLIVVAVVGVALLVTFIMPMIRESMVKAEVCSKARLNLDDACYDENLKKLFVRISRGSEEFQLEGAILQIINETRTETKKMSGGEIDIGILESVTIDIQREYRPDAVGIAPIVKTAEKIEPIICEVTTRIPVRTC